MIAFVFLNEDEASTIYKKVIGRSKYSSASPFGNGYYGHITSRLFTESDEHDLVCD